MTKKKTVIEKPIEPVLPEPSPDDEDTQETIPQRSTNHLKDMIESRIQYYGVHPVFGGPGSLDAWIEQNPDELSTFLAHMMDLGVSSVLEIGTGWKGGLSRFLAAEFEWNVTTVDVKDYGHAFPGVNYVISEEKSDFDLVSFDLVLIDANPIYEAAKENWKYYSSYATKVIAIHDIAGMRNCEGVAQFWDEIAKTKTGTLKKGFHEAIEDSPQRAGIGWLEL